MTIKVNIPAGTTSVSVSGLYQWDYGQILEIECEEFGHEIVEIHFACPNMVMALPRPCTFVNGIGTVPIPDQCLEQEQPITAWICRIDDTQSHTIKTITLPLTKRIKPMRTHGVPEELVDKYNELLTEVTETLGALENGNIVVAEALHANNASRANTAKHAEYASYATTAESAEHVPLADKATTIQTSLVKSCTITKGEGSIGTTLNANTPYLLMFQNNEGYIGSGVIVPKSGVTYCGCAVMAKYSAVISNWTSAGNCAAYIGQTDEYVDHTDKSANGTLYIYTFGSVS